MNILTTYSKHIADNLYQVYWRNGAKKQGVLNIRVEAVVDDREIIAELSALQWLLGHRSVFGETQVGKGLRLIVSSGAIKKLAKAVEKVSDLRDANLGKPHLFPYAKFLGHRFAGLEIQVDKDDSWVMPRAQNDVEEISINAPLAEVLHIPSIGLVEISAHAITRFAKRQANASQEDTWRLLRRVIGGKLRLARLGDDYDRAQAAKHGESGQIWVNDELKWGIVIKTGKIIPVMATAYAVRKSAVADRV